MADLVLFNIKDGFLEALVRGLRSGFLTVDDYNRIAAADDLADVRTALEETDYGAFLQDEALPIAPTTVVNKAREKLAEEVDYLACQAGPQAAKFIDMCRREYMIDNVVMLIQGSVNKQPASDLLAKAHPLGLCEEFRAIPSMDLAGGYDSLYKTIIIDTPIGPYFSDYVDALVGDDPSDVKSLQDVNATFSTADLELLKQSLRKSWLVDFHRFCREDCNDGTAEAMEEVLQTSADFCSLLVTINSLNSTLGSQQRHEERASLFPSIGYLYPDGVDKLRKAWNLQTMRQALEPYKAYAAVFDEVKGYYEAPEGQAATSVAGKSIEDAWFERQTKLCELLFEQQFQYGVLYALIKLREQELRNLGWICDMIVMGRKADADKIVPVFAPRV